MKSTIFWGMGTSGLIEVHRRYGEGIASVFSDKDLQRKSVGEEQTASL
jgi:hypothetical protein